MPTPEFKFGTLRAIRDTIVQALTRFTEENKRLTVAFYGLRVVEKYLQKKVAMELAKLAVSAAREGEDYDKVVNRVMSYYQDFLRLTVGNDE